MSKEDLMKRIAITGSMGSGKSTVSQILRKLGHPVYDADLIAKKVLQSEKTKVQLIERYGEQILNEDLSINKTFLASRIFNNLEDKVHLEAIIHPQVYQELLSINADTLMFAEVPLLYESQGERFFDEVWVVVSDESILRERLRRYRAYTDEMIDERLIHQIPQAEKMKRADVVITNNDDIEALEAALQKALKRYEPTSTG